MLDFLSLPVVGGIVAITFFVLFRRNIRGLIDRILGISYPGGSTTFALQSQTELEPETGQVQLPASIQVSQDNNAIASLIQGKEGATHLLLNWELAPNDPDAKREWMEKIKAWEEGTFELLRDAGATEGELSDFRIVVSYSPTGPAVDKEHAEWKGMLAARIHTLGQLIRDLEKRA